MGCNRIMRITYEDYNGGNYRCTPCLEKYLQHMTKEEILLKMNGTDREKEVIQKLLSGELAFKRYPWQIIWDKQKGWIKKWILMQNH